MNGGSPSAAELAGDPHWFLDNIDPQNRTFSFVRMEREQLAGTPFLDNRLDRTGAAQATAPLDGLDAALASEPPPLGFIWHIGFCCSTLVAHALDHPGKNLSLREPGVTMTLAAAKRGGWFSPQNLGPRLPSAVFRLLARPFSEGEKVLVKPTNTVNTLIADAGQLTSGKMLFLYSDCRDFVLSIAKKRLDGNIFARKLFSIFAGDGDPFGKLPPRTAFELSDLQVAALVWHMQLAQFRRAIAGLGARAASLDCASFLADPEAVLGKLDRFFGLDLGASHIAEVVNGPILSRNAKDESQSYDAEARRREAEAVARRIGSDLDRVVAWSYETATDTPRGRPLGNAIEES